MGKESTGGLHLTEELRQLLIKLRNVQRDLWQNPAPPVLIEKLKQSKTQAARAEEKEKEKPSEAADESRGAKLELLAQLEEEKRALDQKHEQLFAKPYEPLPEHRVEDFLSMYYAEIDRPNRRNPTYLQRLYSPQATLLMVGVSSFVGREQIAITTLRKFEGLSTHHEVVKISMETPTATQSSSGVLLSAKVIVMVKIDKDCPRKVAQWLEWKRAESGSPLDICISREVLAAQDARPLYHWSELPAPVDHSPHMIVGENGTVKAAASLEKESKSEESGSDDDDDDEEDDDGDEEEGEEDDEEEEGEDGEEEEEGAEEGEGGKERGAIAGGGAEEAEEGA